MKKINCFIPYFNSPGFSELIEQLNKSECVDQIFALSSDDEGIDKNGFEIIKIKDLYHTDTFLKIAKNSTTDYSLLINKETSISFGYFALERFLSVASDLNSSIVYSDYYDLIENKQKPHPVINYQEGSLRDDFDFGSVVLLNSKMLKRASAEIDQEYNHAGFYQLRLKILL